MGQDQSVEHNGIIYLINTRKKTAIVHENISNCENIIIPRSFTYKNKEYIVTSISSGAFSKCEHTKSVQFDVNSELQNFDYFAFYESSIEYIFIPQHVTYIEKSAFHCRGLQKVEFSPNSELQIIDERVFDSSSIEFITIPSHVTKICRGAFLFCSNLKRVEFSSNSELKTIEMRAFLFSTIESITIPQNCIDLNDEWCAHLPNLKEIHVDPNNSRYSMFNNKIIVGKPKQDMETYDEIFLLPETSI